MMLCLLALLSSPFATDQNASSSEAPLVSAEGTPSWVYPQRREADGYSILIHAPQVRSWPEFARMEAQAAVEISAPSAASPKLGTVSVTGATELDLGGRIVHVVSPKIDNVRFADGVTPADEQAIRDLIATRPQLDVPLDLFLNYLADDVLSHPPPPGFSTEPPAIVVASAPTLLLFVNGEPVTAPLADTGLEVVVNANWPTFHDPQSGAYYLLDRELWLTSAALEQGWRKTDTLPAGFEKLPAEGEQAAIRQAVPPKPTSQPVSAVHFASQPTELIVSDGAPVLETIPDADGLQYVSNTPSPLFKLGDTWYFLVSGRWFTTARPDQGPWTYTPELPAAFGQIPEDHAMAAVRTSVPGTVEAKTAALEAMLPTKVTAARNAKPPIEVTYAGDPQFEPIPETTVARAVNTGYDVIQVGNAYYLLYAGIWYQGGAPTGPWTVATSVPAAIYDIPPSSPSYHVTQVKVAGSSSEEVVYAYPPSYSESVYVVYGVPYYGTGWYYYPWIYGGYYYPYWGSYGHGSWYNPATGRYASRSVWYGPYGGYSYTEGYNPRTGRYGYVETAWDNDEWASHGETYNPRTGISTETDRYYDEDKNRAEMERTVSRGDQSITTERTTDFDDQTQTVKRETSGGASSEVERVWENGTVTSEGTITTEDGRTATIEGEQTRDGGTTTITGEDRSVELETERQGGRSVTTIEGSEGGQGKSVSGPGPGRTTVVESAEGDLYAGHNGNVYKKTDDGWQQYEGGDWQNVDPAASERAETARQQAQQRDYSRPSTMGGNEQRRFDQPQAGGYDRGYSSGGYSRLERDYAARQRANTQFQRRGMGMRGGRAGGRMRRR
jgi:hypothetical protein